MTIWRGEGGGGDATTDSEINFITSLTNSIVADTALTTANAAASAASALAAATSESNAAASEIAAASSASAASASAISADASANSAANSYDSFDDRYLGSKTVAPTLDNDGNALLVGALYWNAVTTKLFVWSGTAWRDGFFTGLTSSLVTATAGQTVVTTPSYTQNTNTIQVYVNGLKVISGTDFTETSSTSITFSSGLTLGDEVEIVIVQSVSIGTTLASNVSYVPAGTGAVASTVQTKLLESVSVKDFGAVGDGVTNDTTAFSSAVSAAIAGGKVLQIPGGTYLLTANTVNFASARLSIIGIGKPILQFIGSGIGFKLDAGGGFGTNVGGMNVENLVIIGGPSITDGFYSRGIVRSVFRNIEVRECSTRAFHILHGVSNQYDSIKYSGNEAAQITRPTYGVYLTNNGTGYYTADCTFVNCISEDFSLGVGCYIVDGSGNTFIGGTFEGCNIGLTIGTDCRRNHFIGVWFEANGTRDIEVNSTANTFDDCYFGSSSSGPNVEITTGKGTVFRGNYIRTANLQSVSSDTFFVGCGFDQNTGGTLGITGTGTYRILSATKIDGNGNVVGNMDDKLGTVNGLTLSKGIVFPATQVSSTDANTLDDYEEGTWTASFVPTTSGSITLNASFNTGAYIKIGRLVTVTGIFYVSSVSSPVGDLTITGLPFLNGGTNSCRSAASITMFGLAAGATTSIVGQIGTSTTVIFIRKFAAGVTSDIAGDVQAATQIYLSLTYVATA